MKKLLTILLTSALLLVLTSCEKDNANTLSPKQKSFLNYDFQVAEQSNVKQYEIEVSTNGTTWETAGLIFASDKSEDEYKIKVEITRWFEGSSYVLSRIKSVDIDGKVLYSTISNTRANLD